MGRLLPLLALAGWALLTAQMSPPVPPPPPANCNSPEHRQFDFWVGEWDVYRTANPEALVARSKIEPVYFGCGIRENWDPFTLNSGGSLSTYDAKSKQWRQVWIDAQNSWVEFAGGMKDGKMVLSGIWGSTPSGDDSWSRMTFSREAGGSVRQLGESSADQGKTWKTTFDFTYRPRPKP